MLKRKADDCILCAAKLTQFSSTMLGNRTTTSGQTSRNALQWKMSSMLGKELAIQAVSTLLWPPVSFLRGRSP